MPCTSPPSARASVTACSESSSSGSIRTRTVISSRLRQAYVSCNSQLLHHLDNRGGGLCTVAEDLRLFALALRHDKPQLLELRRGALDRSRVDGLAVRTQLRRHRRIARQVQTFLHGHYRGQGHVVHVASAWHLLLAAR